jgi:Type VI secretion system/phage-baseplate injector OB domain
MSFISDPDHLLAQLHEQQQERYYGKYQGTVDSVGENDEGIPCCIKASVPEVYGEDLSPWAKPCVPFAGIGGSGAGMVFLPEPGDQVWIEFAAGRMGDPIWVGGYWTAGKRPAPQGDTVRLFCTKANHQIILDEAADEITVKHPGNPVIKLTASGISCEVSPAKLELTSSKISLSLGAQSIELSSSGIKITGTPEISLNQGVGKFTTAGASLAMDAFKVGG